MSQGRILSRAYGALPACRIPAKAQQNLLRSAPACTVILKPCVTFPCRGGIGRKSRLNIVAFRTEDIADPPQQNTIVIGLDFYRYRYSLLLAVSARPATGMHGNGVLTQSCLTQSAHKDPS